MTRFPWPDGKTFGATLSFDFDAEEAWLRLKPENAQRAGLLSQGAYGPRRAMPEILKLLHRFDATATFFVCGADAERYPDTVRSIADAGHEIAHHGYTHTSPTLMSQVDQQHEIEKGLDVLRKYGPVVGYRSPSWELTNHTRSLLVSHGFTYSSNYLDDIYPYPNPDGIVEVPVSWILDDAPHFWFSHDNWGKTIRSIREVADVWMPEMEGIAERGAHIMLTMHPMLIGRPSRLTLLESVLVWLREKDAWIGSSRSVADLVRDSRWTAG